MVDFIGIGSGKSGSSWLWENIVKHPEVSSGNAKEINYFSTLYHKKSIQWYIKQFEPNNLIKGEFSVTYLDDLQSAERIRAYSSGIKILCILRNPTQRVISDYYHSIRKGTIDKRTSLRDYISVGENLAFGEYSIKIQQYLKYFKPEQILVLEMESSLKNPEEVMQKVYSFLGLKNVSYVPDTLRREVNKGFIPKIALVENLITSISQRLTKSGALRLLEFLKSLNIHHFIRKHNSNFKMPLPSKKDLDYLNSYFENERAYFRREYGFRGW